MTARRDRIAVTLTFFAFGVLTGVWGGRIPAVQELRGLSVGVLGGCLLAPAVGAVLAMPYAGGLVGRRGRRAVFRVATVVWTASVPLLAAAPGLVGFVLTLLVYGAAGGAMDVALNAEAVDVEQRVGRRVFVGMHAAWSLGLFTGAGVAAASVAAGLGVGATLLLAGTATLAALLAGSAWFSAAPAARPGRALALPTRATLALGLLAFCSLFVETAAADWSAVYLHRVAGAGLTVAAFALAAFSVGMVAGRLVADRARERWGVVRVVRPAAAGGALALSAAAAQGGVAGGVVGFFVLGVGTAALFPLAVATGGRRTADPGEGVAAVATVGYAGWVVAPGVVGLVASGASLRWAMGVVAAVLGVAAALTAALRTTDGRGPSYPVSPSVTSTTPR